LLSANLPTDAGTFGGDRTAISGVVDVNGSELGDDLRGNAAANRLDGRGGADRIEGAGGNDILTGGSGRDNFVFNLPTEGIDIVADFTRGEDLIQIAAIGFGSGLAANAAVTVINAANFATTTSGAAGTFIFDNAGADAGTVYWDANGGSGADAIALVRLQNVTSLTSLDFDVA
jgi:Ca2+-binding RTX toxin-like protein